jgi:hypothetical protein
MDIQLENEFANQLKKFQQFELGKVYSNPYARAFLSEGAVKKLRVFDFDDTLVKMDATIYITHADGTKSNLSPAQYAVYTEKPGDKFNFKEFLLDKFDDLFFCFTFCSHIKIPRYFS